MENSHHIYLSSIDSRLAFPDNKVSAFSCLLPDHLSLSSGNWWCALLELHLPEEIQQPLHLCSNICDESIVGEFKRPILARITNKWTHPNHVIYVPLKTRDLAVIHLYLYEGSGEIASLSPGTCYCTLRLCNDEGIRYYSRCS